MKPWDLDYDERLKSWLSRSDPGQFCTIWTMPSFEKGTELDVGSRVCPMQIRSVSVLHNMNHVFFGKKELNWVWEVRSSPSRSDPGQFCTIWTMCSLEKQNWIGCRKSDPAHPDQIRVSFAQYELCVLWKNTAELAVGSQIPPIQIRSGSDLHNML